MLADELDCVDTHRDEHVLAVVTAPAGAVVARRAIGADARGYREARRLADQVAAGRRAWAIDGTGSYGAGLARSLSEQGEAVLEISRTPRTERRLAGKDDALDAVRIERAALGSETLALPRSGERREALRLLLIARRSTVDVRREALLQLRSVIVTAPEPLPEAASTIAREAAQPLQPPPPHHGPSRRARDPARGAQPRPPHPSRNTRSRRTRARNPHPPPSTRPSTARQARRRPIVAAQPIIARSHPGRSAPKPASPASPATHPPPPPAATHNSTASAATGDRQLNRALHTIVLHRRQHDPTTHGYFTRRLTEGKSSPDATRLLKRYLARHLYRPLEQQPAMT